MQVINHNSDSALTVKFCNDIDQLLDCEVMEEECGNSNVKCFRLEFRRKNVCGLKLDIGKILSVAFGVVNDIRIRIYAQKSCFDFFFRKLFGQQNQHVATATSQVYDLKRGAGSFFN